MDILLSISALMVSMYWSIVVVKLILTRHKIGKLPNVIPKEPTGKLLRYIWAPIVMAWVFVPWLTFHGNDHFLPVSPYWLNPLTRFNTFPLHVLGAAISVVALSLSVWCWRVMGRSWRIGIDPEERTKLIVTGPFALVLHPIYSLSLLLMIGTMLTVASPVMLIIGFTHITLLILEALREEQFLLQKYPEEYPLQLQKLWRFVPKFSA